MLQFMHFLHTNNIHSTGTKCDTRAQFGRIEEIGCCIGIWLRFQLDVQSKILRWWCSLKVVGAIIACINRPHQSDLKLLCCESVSTTRTIRICRCCGRQHTVISFVRYVGRYHRVSAHTASCHMIYKYQRNQWYWWKHMNVSMITLEGAINEEREKTSATKFQYCQKSKITCNCGQTHAIAVQFFR